MAQSVLPNTFLNIACTAEPWPSQRTDVREVRPSVSPLQSSPRLSTIAQHDFNLDHELPDLLKSIALYEQAVGRAFLTRRSLSNPNLQTRSSFHSSPEQGPGLQACASFEKALEKFEFDYDSIGQTNLQTPGNEQAFYTFSTPTQARSTDNWDKQLDPNYNSHSTSTLYSNDTDSACTNYDAGHASKIDLLNDYEIFVTSSNEQMSSELADLTNFDDSAIDAVVVPDSDVHWSILSQSPWSSLHRSPSSDSQSSDHSGTMASQPPDAVTRDHCEPSFSTYSPRTPQRPVVLRPAHTADGTSRGWSVDLDDTLRTEVKAQKAAGIEPLQWTKIARRIGCRSGVQCQARWAEVLDENIRKGRWTPVEDEILKRGFRRFGTRWSKIAEEIGTRTQRQCRSRWLQINNTSTIISIGTTVEG